MIIDILHNLRGDKRKKVDTSTERGRQEAAVLINKLLKSGTAIFLERGKKTLRVKSYDAEKDMLVVDAEIHGTTKPVKTKASKARATAVAPVAGGR